MPSAYLSGLFLGLSLIIAIGAQNAFVLRQGLRNDHVFAVCLVCTVSDAVLIVVGVGGFATAVRWLPGLDAITRFGGAAFLLVYGLRALWSAARSSGTLAPRADGAGGLGRVLGICLALTWLNPHVYLDTVVLLGSVSTRFPDDRLAFALGAMTASGLFFFALGYGARLLRPIFAKPAAWRVLDCGIGVTMWAIAARLVV